MKKIILLLTLLCTVQLHTMEPPREPDYMATLPKEVKQLIASALTQSNSAEEAINAIRSLTQTNTEFYMIINDPITMRSIIQLLVQKFNAPSEYIAKKLSTPGSLKYINLSLQLQAALLKKDFNTAENLIKDGADIDYQVADVYPMLCTPNLITTNLLLILNSMNLKKKQIDENTQILSKILFLKKESESFTNTIVKAQIQKNITNIEAIIETIQTDLQDLIDVIHNFIEDFNNIFKDDEQRNHFIKALDNQDFRKTFTILEPNTILSLNPTYFCYQLTETKDTCTIGANFSFVMYAIATNQLDLLNWLINHKANLELTMGTGDTALSMALRLHKKEIVELLIHNGANVNQQNRLQVHNKHIYNKLIAKPGGSNIQKVYISNINSSIDDNTFKSLISNKIDLREYGPLYYLFLLNDGQKIEYDLLKLLLDSGADPNLQDIYKMTPLMSAVLTISENIIESMKLLLERGANPTIKSAKGRTALDILKQDVKNDPYTEEKIKLLEDAMKKYENSEDKS